MGRVFVLVAVGLVLVVGDARAVARRPVTRCCVTIHDPDGTERPYCFNVEARRRLARRLCRLMGGMPARAAVR